MDMLTIALSARGTTYGALTIAQRAGIGFDADAVAFLEDFAHRVAVTLDTTRALAESRRVAAVLSRDLTPPTAAGRWTASSSRPTTGSRSSRRRSAATSTTCTAATTSGPPSWATSAARVSRPPC